mmetsp:Transcript_10869/g.32425  ORF Transcript_10869/g.32425 Transcript_10869/m.32425 type:complete len:260 (+) Transcript_10869:107-886(+)|eukprot:CAMPEP_0119275000 /NCGR_PEP_ID=MMETSP1329-20130426/13087_1 /TAXON_ID=114041 /ORGANISM="Genus nov. species nov., Strain RCC1024" /LENGTH=259 /DNA_ID=CAMNT_0007275359 /DNA_START=75 /DNA_END=854 /DNA_ORIENTATION=-
MAIMTALLAPILATTVSLVAPCFLGLLATANASFEGPPTLGAALKAAGAVCLFVGHYTLASKKPAFARGDYSYLGGACCLFALFGGGCFKALGYVETSPGLNAAAAAGLLLGVTFADMAATINAKTPGLAKAAIACGCCGCSCLVAVAATGAGAFAMGASVSFLTANSLVLVKMHTAPAGSRIGQAFKVAGSACLFSGNAIGLGWTAPGTFIGVVGSDAAEALRGLDALPSAAVVLAGLGVVYGSAVTLLLDAPKQKTA